MHELSLSVKMNKLHLWREADKHRFSAFWEIVGNSIVSTCLSLDYIDTADADELLLYILARQNKHNVK